MQNLEKLINLKKLNNNNINRNYIKWMNDHDVLKYTEQRFQKHTFKKIIKFILEKNKSKIEFLYGIFFKQKNLSIHVGNIKLGPINKNHLSADVSYIIGEKRFWKKGIGSLAVKKIIKIAKKKFKLKKLTAGCYENNYGSIKVLKKNSFKKEATFVSQILFKKKRIKKFVFGLKI